MRELARRWIGQYQWKWIFPASIRRGVRRVIPGIRQEELDAVADAVFEATGGRVMTGPFAGMRYIREATGSALSPKLLGTYEKEIAHCVNEACDNGYEVLADIGAAEGYYAVGMAYRCPRLKVVAFEQSEVGREMLRSPAKAQAVESRVAMRGRCSHAELQAALGGAGRRLVICDIDGGEVELLHPDAVPELKSCDVLVELHDCFSPGISERIRARFARTHDVQVIMTCPRRSWDCPLKSQLGRRRAYVSVQEHRPGSQSWFWMRHRVNEAKLDCCPESRDAYAYP